MNPDTSASFATVQQVVGQNGRVAELQAQFAESAKLEQAIQANLKGLGYGFWSK